MTRSNALPRTRVRWPELKRTNMRTTSRLAILALALALAACSGIETRPGETDTFAAANYTYYKWRSKPMTNSANSQDPMYLIDPILRRQVDANLREKGYVLDEERAQFSVDYVFATGLRMGARTQQVSNINPIPSVTPNRQVNQAVVDNAYALGGVKETDNIALLFNDVQSRKEVWHVIITKIVEDVNKIDRDDMRDSLKKGIRQALDPLPEAR